jgi:hypothetical protein
MTQDEILDIWGRAGGGVIDDMPYTLVECFAKLVAAKEREAIKDEFWLCVQSDLENGVKSLNEKASEDFARTMPELSKFGDWLEARGQE